MNPGWEWILFTISFFSSGSAVKGPPKVHPQNRLVTAEEGEMIKLPCPITANPEPLFEWRKDGTPVDDTWPRYVIRRHFLRIKGVREEDTGDFTCTGVNGFGQETFTFSLLIYGENLPPQESQEPAELLEVSPSSHSRVRIGQAITLTCKATGVPAPKVTWSKDGTPLHKSGTKLHVTVNSIMESGLYTCTATNPLSMVNHNFSVEVAEEEFFERDPQILQSTNATVSEGGNTTLQCVVRSSLTPEIQWLKLLSDEEMTALPVTIRNNTLHRDGRTYRYISTPGHRLERDNGTYMSKLHIGKASAYDAGVYICVGTTVQGYNYKEIHLTVQPGFRQEFTTNSRDIDSGVNWLFLLIPGVTLVIIMTSVIIVCKARRSSPEKTYPAGPQNPVLESEDPSADTPLHAIKPYIKGGGTLPPDVVYHDGSSFSTRVTNMGPMNGSIRYADPYLYPENSSYLDPNYSDPYLEPQDVSVKRSTLDGRGGNTGFDTHLSEHSYARLTQSTQSSTSPLPPPPYAYQLPFSSPHSQTHPSAFHAGSQQFAYTHKPPNPQTKYIVHYNL